MACDAVFGVVVTYEPDGDLAARLAPLIPQLGRLVVVDNASASPTAITALSELEADPSVSLLRNRTNLGLARALNQGLERTVEAGARWTLLLDQDSEPLPGLIESLHGVVRDHPRAERLAVVGTNYVEPSGRLHAPASGVAWSEVASVITSGSIVSSVAIDAVGPMRDGLFIDYVDHEFCLRCRAAGFEIALAARAGLRHGIGRVRRHRLGPITGATSHHATARRYYRTRNQLLVYRRFGWREPRWLVRDAWQAAKSAVQMCLFETERPAKLHAMLDGARDAVLGREGRSDRW